MKKDFVPPHVVQFTGTCQISELPSQPWSVYHYYYQVISLPRNALMDGYSALLSLINW